MTLTGEKGALVNLLVWLLAIAWVAFIVLAVWPAWRAQAELRAALADRQEQLANITQITESIPASRARLNRVRQVVLEREAQLVVAAQDTDLIRQIERIAGSGAVINSLTYGDKSPLPAEADLNEAPYWQAPFRLEASGGWSGTLALLQGLETQVPGLRLEAVQLAGVGDGSWRLQVTGSQFTIREPLPAPAG